MKSGPEPGELTLRIRSPWGPFLAFCWGCLGFAAAASNTMPGYVIAAVVMLLAWRAASGGISGNGQSVRVRSVLSTRTIAVRDLTAASAEVIDHKLVPVWAPVIETASRPHKVAVRALAGYSRSERVANRRVQAVVERIRNTYDIAGSRDERSDPMGDA